MRHGNNYHGWCFEKEKEKERERGRQIPPQEYISMSEIVIVVEKPRKKLTCLKLLRCSWGCDSRFRFFAPNEAQRDNFLPYSSPKTRLRKIDFFNTLTVLTLKLLTCSIMRCQLHDLP